MEDSEKSLSQRIVDSKRYVYFFIVAYILFVVTIKAVVWLFEVVGLV